MTQTPTLPRLDDAPEVTEVFADCVPSLVVESNGVVRIDLAVTRFGEPQGDTAPPLTRRVVSRVVLNANGFVDLYNRLQQAHTMLKQSGAISETPVVPVVPTQKH